MTIRHLPPCRIAPKAPLPGAGKVIPLTPVKTTRPGPDSFGIIDRVTLSREGKEKAFALRAKKVSPVENDILTYSMGSTNPYTRSPIRQLPDPH
jgi:hypothetical protein